GHTYIDWSRPDAPYSRPIGLSVTAPEWLQPAIYRVVAHDLRMILPHTPVDPIALPRPGAPLFAPIVAVSVHRADRRWRPFTGTVILQATAIAADAPPFTIWPADAFSPSRQNMLAIHGDGVVTAEASVSAVLTRDGFEWPDAVADRLAQRISRALIAELVEQLQPPDDPSTDNAGASASARPAPAPTSMLPPLSTVIAATPPPVDPTMLVNRDGLTGAMICNGVPVPQRLSYGSDGWAAEYAVDYKHGGACEWRYRLSNPSARPLVNVALRPWRDGPHGLLGLETLRCAEPTGAEVPCERLTVPARGAIDVTATAPFEGCLRFGPETSSGYDLAVRLVQPDRPSPRNVWLHGQLLVHSPLDDWDCPARLPSTSAVAALERAIAPHVQGASGGLAPLQATDWLTVTDVSDLLSGDGPYSGAGLNLGNQFAAFVATTDARRCVGWFAYSRFSLYDEPTGPDTPRAFALQCADDADDSLPLALWAQTDGRERKGGGVVAVRGLDGMDGMDRTMLARARNGEWVPSSGRIRHGVTNGGVWADDANGQAPVHGTLTFRVAADLRASTPARATFQVPEVPWTPIGSTWP
ncbi:MAG: hypothetical protein ABI780_14985, partial [Ardenticatenales bacterium]